MCLSISKLVLQYRRIFGLIKSKENKKTKVLIADDHKIVRDGLKILINTHKDMEVVGESDSGRGAVKLALKLNPDVIIMDICMPDLTGVDATCRILKNQKNIKVIGSSMIIDLRLVIGMLKAGASGFILLDSSFEELAVAIRSVVEDNIYICSQIPHKLAQEILNEAKIVPPIRKKPVKPKRVI